MRFLRRMLGRDTKGPVQDLAGASRGQMSTPRWTGYGPDGTSDPFEDGPKYPIGESTPIKPSTPAQASSPEHREQLAKEASEYDSSGRRKDMPGKGYGELMRDRISHEPGGSRQYD